MDVELKPFEFFDLPTQIQYEYLLKMDLESINNLCTAADPNQKKHKDPRATVFFRKLCEDDVGFWQEKLKTDFYRSTKKLDTWREEYIRSWIEFTERWIETARQGNVKRLKKLFTKKPQYLVDARGFEGFTALMGASSEGKIAAMEYLLSQGADVNAKNDDGVTPLMLAATESVDAVKLLVDAGANIDAQDNQGYTALYYAPFEYIKNYLRSLKNIKNYLVSQGATT